jgi:signal transduction histidine kinase
MQILLDNASKYAGAPHATSNAGVAHAVAAGDAGVAHAVATGDAGSAAETGGTPAQPHAPHTSQPPANHAQATVHVVLRPGAGARQHAVLTVTNSGTVIDSTALPHLFERFYRAEYARSDTEGSGLGLSLAQAIVKAHHGSIGVSSDPAHGTAFIVTL